jgi:hypothetical protein
MAKPKNKRQIDTLFIQAVRDIRQFYFDRDEPDSANPVATSEAFCSLSKRDQHDARAAATSLIVFSNYVTGLNRGNLDPEQRVWYLIPMLYAFQYGAPGPLSRYL